MPVQKPRARTDDLVIEEVDDELLVYDSTNKRAHCLGATAARVWRACDGHSDVSALSEALELDAEVVSQALDELEALELLDTQGLKVVQAGSGNGGTGSPADSWPQVGEGRRRDRRGPAGLLDHRQLRPWPLATPTNLPCALFSTNSCGTSSGAGAVAGCCCCCQGGGDCKIGGAITTCERRRVPHGYGPHVLWFLQPATARSRWPKLDAAAFGDSTGCGCAFAGGTANQLGCLCNDTSGQCNDNPQTGCVTPCIPAPRTAAPAAAARPVVRSGGAGRRIS